MKYNIILSFIAFYLLAVSCEKVIDLDLNKTNPIPVFEAYIENDSTCYVKASWTSSYYDNSSSLELTNAIITIADQSGATENLTYQGNGIYRGSSLIGIPTNRYTFTAKVDDKSYTAISEMPSIVPIDSLTLEYVNSFGGAGNFIYINYSDPAGVENFYAKKVTYTPKDALESYTDFNIMTDYLSEGINTRTLANFQFYMSGDTANVELIAIEKPVYIYFKSLASAIGGAGPSSSAPANPTSNIEGGALGYFSASSKAVKSIIIP